jgi:hypothetical protein
MKTTEFKTLWSVCVYNLKKEGEIFEEDIPEIKKEMKQLWNRCTEEQRVAMLVLEQEQKVLLDKYNSTNTNYTHTPDVADWYARSDAFYSSLYVKQ